VAAFRFFCCLVAFVTQCDGLKTGGHGVISTGPARDANRGQRVTIALCCRATRTPGRGFLCPYQVCCRCDISFPCQASDSSDVLITSEKGRRRRTGASGSGDLARPGDTSAPCCRSAWRSSMTQLYINARQMNEAVTALHVPEVLKKAGG